MHGFEQGVQHGSILHDYSLLWRGFKPLPERYNQSMQKVRLDLLLVERGLAESRTKAQALVMAGHVRVDRQVELKASAAVSPNARLDL